MFKIACQTIIFGDEVRMNEHERVFKAVADIGYDGMEYATKCFDLDNPAKTKELLEKTGATLPIIHVGGNFLDTASIKEQMDNFGKTVKFTAAVGGTHIYVSGVYDHNKSFENYITEAGVYRDMGKRCADEGLRLCYHNHDWEMINLQGGMEVLLENAPELLLVPDVGWVTVSNVDPVVFLTKHFDRIEAVHFKDFKKVRAFTELGTGFVDFPAVAALLKEKNKPMWITAEQDKATNTPEESAKINYDYIKSLF
ncbi:MAG: sugar phosphate isomerase/epimerase [Oscillospiraceae bacterium]|nr:sugar phosphate isomerase/epimerase [Oscillospiraceae bacterium]